jgi:hypothetical protein
MTAVSTLMTRWRLGIAPCLELLVDLPTYFATLRGPKSSGFSDAAPAIKWQVSPIPGTVDLSLVFGVALPTGAEEIAGRGAQPKVSARVESAIRVTLASGVGILKAAKLHATRRPQYRLPV